MDPIAIDAQLTAALKTLAAVGEPLQWLLLVSAIFLGLAAFLPGPDVWREWGLRILVGLLVAGEGVLLWFHWRL